VGAVTQNDGVPSKSKRTDCRLLNELRSPHANSTQY